LGIFLIEDNKGDIFLISELLQETGLDFNITIAENGQLALTILKTMVKEGASLPDFVILDLNLPKVHVFEILAYMKGAEALQAVPVAVMTGSLNKEDEVRARSMGVVDYRIKPSGCEDVYATGLWLKKSLESLPSRRRGDGRACAFEAARTASLTGIPLGGLERGRRHQAPSMPKYPLLGDWTYRPIGPHL
jgi:CheY-like chemotaxis protein